MDMPKVNITCPIAMSGIPHSHESEGRIPYTKRKATMTGMVHKKCNPSIMTLLSGITERGNTVFLIICALAINEKSEFVAELANHCQGTAPLLEKGYN
jgi:hypothetical protein